MNKIDVAKQGKSSATNSKSMPWAYNQDGSKSAKVRILFDNGSQRTYITYITNNLQKKLRLKGNSHLKSSLSYLKEHIK